MLNFDLVYIVHGQSSIQRLLTGNAYKPLCLKGTGIVGATQKQISKLQVRYDYVAEPGDKTNYCVYIIHIMTRRT